MAKFFQRNLSKMIFLTTAPAIAASPTMAELTAGVDLSPFITDIGGWELTNSPIATPNLADAFTSQVPGEDTVSTCTLTFLDDTATTAFRTAVPKDSAGYMILARYGKIATKRVEVWKCTSTGLNDKWTTANEAAKTMATFAITAVPTQSGTIGA